MTRKADACVIFEFGIYRIEIGFYEQNDYFSGR